MDRWDKELDAFATVNTMMRDGKTLFQTCEQSKSRSPGHPEVASRTGREAACRIQDQK